MALYLCFCARIYPEAFSKALFSLDCKQKILELTEASCRVLGTSAQLETYLAVLTYSANSGFAAIAAILFLKVVHL